MTRARTFRYLRQLNLDTDLVTAKNFNIYDPLSQGKALILDGQTLAHIEVLQNSQGGIEGTLLQLLSRCGTPFGACSCLLKSSARANQLVRSQASVCSRSGSARLFAKLSTSITGVLTHLLQSITVLKVLLNRRLDAVDDLLANPTFGNVFDKMAKKLPDLERLLSRIHAKSCKKQELYGSSVPASPAIEC